MFEKDLNIAFLLDFYGDVLSERKRLVLNFYYNEDLSLAEIGNEIGISPQGARALIKKAEEELHFYEERLGLAEKFRQAQQCADRLLYLLGKNGDGEEIYQAAQELADTVR